MVANKRTKIIFVTGGVVCSLGRDIERLPVLREIDGLGRQRS